MMKKKTAAHQVNFDSYDKQTANHSDILEYFAGRDPGHPIYRAEGCKLDIEAVVARTSNVEPFDIYIKIGDVWHKTIRLSQNDSGINQLREAGNMITCDLSPEEIQRMKLKEAKQREKEELEEAHKKSRKEHHEQQRIKAEAKHRALMV